jgi:hypothetical protein
MAIRWSPKDLSPLFVPTFPPLHNCHPTIELVYVLASEFECANVTLGFHHYISKFDLGI